MPETKTDVVVRPLEEDDLPEADRTMRLAFGTFLGLPDRRVRGPRAHVLLHSGHPDELKEPVLEVLQTDT